MSVGSACSYHVGGVIVGEARGWGKPTYSLVQYNTYQTFLGVHCENMEIYVPLITSLLLLTAVLQPTQQIFPITSKSDLVDVIYPPQVHRINVSLNINLISDIFFHVYLNFWAQRLINNLNPLKLTATTLNQDINILLPHNTLVLLGSSQAITVKTRTVTESHTHQEVLPFSNTQTTITAACNCPPKHYWKLNRKLNHDYDNGTVETSTIYRCARLRKCNAMEFCGNIRADYYFTYYQCSCPMGHMCLQKDQKKYQVSELLYNSTAYRAVCTPNNS
ncbi:hypothetical protein C0J52_19406 [Blattella germanica]|nr:hypothetical protein C0J52_19406 [Blattella germanica]